MLIYCDSSALVKMIIDESESEDLEFWLSRRGEVRLCASVLARTEVIRAVHRFGEAAVQDAQELFRELSTIDLDNDLAGAAAHVEPSALRSLDAVHLATALRIGDVLTAVVTYDKRMIDAARAAGLTVHHPGA